LSQYQGGSSVGGQGNGTVGTLTNADLWGMYWSGAGAGSSSSSSDEGSLTNDPTILAQYTGGSGIGGITPLVYNPQSDGSPVFQLGVWTGDDERVQFVQTADTGNQGTDEGDTSQSDDKSRARSWWGILGWFLGDGPIDDGGSQVGQTGDTGSGQDGGTRTGSWFDLINYGRAGDWLDQDFGGGTYGDPSTFGQAWGWARGLFSIAPGAGELSDGTELITGVGPNGEPLTPGQRGATAIGLAVPFVPAPVARGVLRPLTDIVDDVLEAAVDLGGKAGKNAGSVGAAGRVAGGADDAAGQVAPNSIDPAATRPKLRKSTKEQAQAAAPKTPDGDYLDPYTGKVIPKEGPFDYGHPAGEEWWRLQEQARAEGWTRKQVIEAENAKKFQIEDPSSNRGHKYEKPR
jgi:hypothetical protein